MIIYSKNNDIINHRDHQIIKMLSNILDTLRNNSYDVKTIAELSLLIEEYKQYMLENKQSLYDINEYLSQLTQHNNNQYNALAEEIKEQQKNLQEQRKIILENQRAIEYLIRIIQNQHK